MLKKFAIGLFNSAVDLNQKNIISLLNFKNGDIFLDLGCDDGSVTLELTKNFSNIEKYGVEIVEKRAAIASKKGINVLSFDLNKKFKLPDNFFDVIHANQVIEHLTDSDNFVEEIYRILKPGGYAVISTENASSWCNIFASIMGWQIFSLTNFSRLAQGIGNPLAMHKGEVRDLSSWNHVRIYNIKGLMEYFKIAGFHVDKVKGSGYFPLPSKFAQFDAIHSHFITFKICKKS